MLRPFFLALACLLLTSAAPAPPPQAAPRYTKDGRLQFPTDYREWIFLSSGLDMSYTTHPAMAGQHMFGNTFVPQAAYKTFQATGTWPDKTIIILENRGGATQGSINKRGVFQTTDYMGAEAHVKDTTRFKNGWAFFAFDPTPAPAPEIPHTQSCYACHSKHAAVDTTFVQFYPTLLPTATRLKTLTRAYLAQTPSSGG